MEPAAQTKERVSEFNVAAHGLRGVACLFVLVAHILVGVAEHVYPGHRDYVSLVQVPSYFGTFGVYLFFVISGYVVLPSAIRYPPGEFALRRWLRVYPLFFAFSLLFVLLNALTNAYPKQNSVEAVIAGFLFLDLFTATEQLTPNAWSLTYEVIFYVLTCACVFAALRQSRTSIRLLAFGVAAAFLVVEPLSIYFVIGIAIRMLHRMRPREADRGSRLLELLCMGCLIVAVASGRRELEWDTILDPGLFATLTLTAAYFYLATVPGSLSASWLSARVVAYAGTISFSLYLTHPYIYFPLRQAFVRAGLFTENVAPSVGLFFVLVTALSFAASHIVYRVLERHPYEWFFRQRIYRVGGRRPA